MMSTSFELRTFATSVLLLLLPDLAVRSVSQWQPQQHRQRPGYQLKFEVTYNISDTTWSSNQVVSNRCGEHYATTLLQHFIRLNSWLEAFCNATSVRIDHKAVVYMHNGEVRVETTVNLNVSGKESDGDSCAQVLNDTLQDVNLLDHRLRLIFNLNSNTSRMISSINGTGDCSPATMHPAMFHLKQKTWVCEENYVFSSVNWECYKDGTGHQTTQAAIDRSTTSKQLRTTTTTTSLSSRHLSSSNHTGRLVSDGFQATVSPATQPPETTSEVEAPGPKYWGIEALRNFSRIHLTEGGRVFELPVRLWYNETAICHDDPACQVSMVVSIDSKEEHPELICRRTGEAIPQVAVSRPLQMSSLASTADETDFCGLRFPPSQTVIESAHVLLKAIIDHKYDGMQTRWLRLSLVRHKTNSVVSMKELLFEMPVLIEDRDKKATCQSINDPHITTFDGLEYNNFFEGEFILYRHRTLPFSVHAIYQKCHPNLEATCNCGVAVQSGDDVIVIDRCFRRHLTVPALRSRLSPDDPPSTMKIQLFLNGNLTPGTKIHEDADGKKYFIYLPHGAYVKVITNGQLINLWIVPSPNDLYMTEGLCGVYDWNRANDIHLRNGSAVEDLEETNVTANGRPQPTQFIKDWSVDVETKESLFRGVARASKSYEPGKYCICGENGTAGSTPMICGYATDISRCDIHQGQDVTTWLVKHALPPRPNPSPRGKRRMSRDVNDNSVLTGHDSEEQRIVISKEFVPPSKYKWKNAWNEEQATDYCRKHIKDEYRIGQLCSQIPPVNFKQEITTCTEDIKITGNTSWADSARDSMKEQCLEELQKNGSLPLDVYKQIVHGMCINDCSDHGQCRNGVCQCDEDYGSADCSIHLRRPPYVNVMPKYGLCDVRYMNCNRVIVYGGDFIDSTNLTCHLQKCKMTDRSYEPLGVTVVVKAIFINFNAVECPIPTVHIYLIRISNNGLNTSDPLLFLPFDSVCNTCNVFNTSCLKRRNSCIIDGRCYGEGEKSPEDGCLICKAYDDEYQWTTTPDGSCDRAWWETFHLPDWAVALGAAIGGSLIGILTGFLLYRCCCRSKKTTVENDVPSPSRPELPDCAGFETDSFLHRNRGIPTFAGNPFSDLDAFEPDLQEPTSVFYNDGKGVENGVDSTTYF